MPSAPPLPLDVEISAADVAGLASADALAGLFTRLGYDSSTRTVQTPANLGITAEGTVRQIRRIEQVASCDGDLHVFLFEVESLTQALTRALVRRLKDLAGDYLLTLTDGWDRLDFVLVEREVAGRPSAIGVTPVSVVARVLSVERRKPSAVDLRVLRRFSRTETDRFLQFDKLRSAFSVAYWSEELFNNRALFSDHYLTDADRLRDLPEWAEDPKTDWLSVREMFRGAAARWAGKPESVARAELFEPLLQRLGWSLRAGKRAGSEDVEPDYVLTAPGTDRKGAALAVCLAYPWGRFLDGKDPQRDTESPEENPTAVVVSLLERGDAPWAIVTNGKLWRLYSARAHSRATNFYEIDLEETLAFSGPQASDPAVAFRYFWLFFRRAAFEPGADVEADEVRASFVDRVLADSEEYAKELGERLKADIFEEVFPHLAKGFLEGIREREGLAPADLPEERLDAVYRGTLTLLYRLLFLLYAESRDLLPVRATRAYRDLSLADLKRKIAETAGSIADDRDARIGKAFRVDRHEIYDRLKRLFRAIDEGDPALNVPVYNGGLFVTQPSKDDPSPDAETARFLARHTVPDRHLAAALDRLCRGIDTRRQDLVQVDYKSLGVRQLGSIYEGLLEFRLRVAPERLAIVRKSGKDVYQPARDLDERARERAERQGRILKKGEVYLENDKRERKATGSYYTPDHIVRYIVEQAVGPILAERFDALRPKLRRAQKERSDFLKRREADQKRGVRPEPLEKAEIFGRGVAEELFDVRVLDPAMGSGHFLVEAVDFITDRMLAFLNGFRPWHPVVARLEETRREILREAEKQEVSIDREKLTDVNLLKRHVLKRCIFGVDLNPMAVELAKVSLWLDAFTLGAPLSFLDHHLRCGNSLVGVTVAEVEREVKGEENLLLFGGRFDRLVGATDMMRRVGGLSDVTSAQVRESREQYRNASDLLAPFKRMLDVYTAGLFRRPASGQSRAASAFETRPEVALLSSHEADSLFAASTAAEAEKAIRKLPARHRAAAADALRIASEHRFFHWELEFPEVFYGPRPGTTQVIERLQDAGFDAVIGNPPYAKVSGTNDPLLLRFLKSRFRCAAYKPELYAIFGELSLGLVRANGAHSFIVPNSFLAGTTLQPFREALAELNRLDELVLFKDSQVFAEAKMDSVIYTARRARPDSSTLMRFRLADDRLGTVAGTARCVSRSEWLAIEGKDFRVVPATLSEAILRRILESSAALREFASVHLGLVLEDNKALSTEPKGQALDPLLFGRDVERYVRPTPTHWFRFRGARIVGGTKDESIYRHGPRVILQAIRNLRLPERLVATIADANTYTIGTLHNLIVRDPRVNPYFLLGILNSDLMNDYYRGCFPEHRIKGEYLERLPIPDPEKVAAFGRLRDELTAIVKEALHAPAPSVGTDGSGSVDPSLIARIEAVVRRLYGVDEELSM